MDSYVWRDNKMVPGRRIEVAEPLHRYDIGQRIVFGRDSFSGESLEIQR